MKEWEKIFVDYEEYIMSLGGVANLKEADNTNNGYNRILIAKYKECYPEAVGVRVNPSFGSEDIFVDIPEKEVCNFFCDMVIKGPDKEMYALVREWRESCDWHCLEKIHDACKRMDGILFIWT